MGLAVVAAHLIVIVSLASAGTVLVATVTDTAGDQLEAQGQALRRLNAARNEVITLVGEDFQPNPNPGRLTTEWRNDGSEEIDIDDVTVLVDGDFRARGDLAVFEVQEDRGSDIWMPGETLEVRSDEGDTSVTIIGPHGTAAHRRP